MCNGTKETIKIVKSCPHDRVVLHERSQKKMCNSFQPCLGEPLVFHCIRFKDKLIEVCAPRTDITGNIVF